MKRIYLPLLAACVAACPAVALAQQSEPSDLNNQEYRFAPISPSTLENATEVGNWGAHWFAGVGAGGSVFAGNTLGCGDMFDRARPLIRIEAGKWFTPAFGARIAAEGLWFANPEMRTSRYQSYRADFLYDVLGMRRFNADRGSWALIPYLGIGFAYNSTDGVGTIVGGYGVQAKKCLTERLALSFELGGQVMPARFDAHKGHSRFADNLFGLSVGLSYNIGTSKWKHVYDAMPYIDQYDRIMAYCSDLRSDNRRLRAARNADARVAAEFKKILAVEGLLAKYWPRLSALAGEDSEIFSIGGWDVGGGGRRPVNDYSGLNSLLARIGSGQYGGEAGVGVEDFAEAVVDLNNCPYDPAMLAAMLQNLRDILGDEDFDAYLESLKSGASPKSVIDLIGQDKWKQLLALVNSRETCLGAPIYFFFKIRTASLTDPSQLVNLDAAARVANAYGLNIRVYGSADSATGSSEINERLSNDRAQYIRQQLVDRGVPESSVQVYAKGGVAEFSPKEANRNTRIELYKK